MHFPRILLTAVGAVILLPSAFAQSCPQGQREHKDDAGKLWCIDSEGRSYAAEAKRQADLPRTPAASSSFAARRDNYGSANPPRVMRLCAKGLCHTLTWNDGHYDAITDGHTDVDSVFGIVRWDRHAVDFTGIVLTPDRVGSYITGIFTGNISQAGNSLDNGTDRWRAGIATGSLPFTMTWNSNDPSNVVPHQSQYSLPASFRLCGGPCSHQILNGGQYEAYMDDTDNHAPVATYTVASLSPELAYMNVALPNGFRGIVTGRVSGRTLIDGKVTWLNCFHGDTLRVRAAWGDDIASIGPGPIIDVRQQAFATSAQQAQINPWALILGLVVGAAMDGDSDSEPKPKTCPGGCLYGNRAEQIHKSMQPK